MPRSLLCISCALLTFANTTFSAAADVPLLQNAGFEAGVDRWNATVYGAKPIIEPDSQVFREGKQSLRISATESSDTALSQLAIVKQGHWYRFSGWVRTRDLKPSGSPTYGTMQIQYFDGGATIAQGENHQGDTDWVREVIEFEAPLGGRISVVPFFVGFGKGTGTVWFDDFQLEELPPQKEPIRISNERLPGKISPLQYGQFVEYLCDVIPSMWAEKLYDGSFEGQSSYKVAFIRETDFQERPWHPYGATNRGQYSLDTHEPVSGHTSQRIHVPQGVPCSLGVSQDGIAVTRGVACDFSLFLRANDVQGAVKVRLIADGQELASCSFEPSTNWARFQSRITPIATATDATLSITFSGPGTVWIDNASLMPIDSVKGWRKEVVEATKALKPGIIRFGGSALDDSNLGEFEWEDTIGDPDRRKPFRAWGGLQPTGPGLEEIVQFCEMVGAEPLMCVRVSKKGPESLFEQAQYFNGLIDTPMGTLRAQNGHPEPYRIRYWQVGNERAGADYEAALAANCKALLDADPSIILLSSYPTPGVLEKAGHLIRYICPHHYDCGNLQATERDLAANRELIRRHAPGKEIKIAVTEWNTTAGHWGVQRNMLWTLENAIACSRYHNLIHRNADIVEIANRSNLINSFCSGIIQVDRHRLYKVPTYFAQELYAHHAETLPLRINQRIARPLDISATIDEAGTSVVLFAINPTLSEIARELDYSAHGNLSEDVRIWTLADRKDEHEPDARNSFDDPLRVAPVESKLSSPGPRFEYKFPALSITVIKKKVK